MGEEEIGSSSYWVCHKTDGIEDDYYSLEIPGKKSLPSATVTTRMLTTRMFTRRDIHKLVRIIGYEHKCNHDISPAALAIVHQVFEDYLFDQLTLMPAPLGKEINSLCLMRKVKCLEKQVAELTRENELKRKSMEEARESLQAHFDCANSRRRVSP